MQATIFFPKYEKKTPTKFVNLPSKIIKLMYYDIHKKKYLFIFSYLYSLWMSQNGLEMTTPVTYG